jgi:hypothetical protein
MTTYLPLLRSDKLTSFCLKQPLLLLRQTFLEKVVLFDIVDVDRNMNDHEIVEQDF